MPEQDRSLDQQTRLLRFLRIVPVSGSSVKSSLMCINYISQTVNCKTTQHLTRYGMIQLTRDTMSCETTCVERKLKMMSPMIYRSDIGSGTSQNAMEFNVVAVTSPMSTLSEGTLTRQLN